MSDQESEQAQLPKLADGSRWDGDILIDRDGDEVSIDDGMLSIDNSCGCGECHPADALAVIRRAGLDPLAIAAKELVAEIRDCTCSKDIDRIVYEDDIKAALEKLEALL